MHLSFTFRNLDASEALKDYARDKLERIHKYFPDPIKVHVVFSSQRGYLFAADVQITLHNGLLLKGVEATEDFHSSIDLVMAKIERQLRKYKDRIRDHKPHSGPERAMIHRVMSTDQDGEGAQPADAASTAQAQAQVSGQAEAQAPAPAPSAASDRRARVVREEKFVAQPMTVDDAIMRMNLLHESFLVFNNVETHEINVVYRREDATYGLIETSH